MKKILTLILSAGLAVVSLSAQENEPKQYLPKQGDWAIGFDAKPVLQIVEAIFSEESDEINELPAIGGESSLLNGPTLSIMGKYMLTDQLAVKANLGILVENTKNSGYSTDDAAAMLNPLANAKVADIMTTRETGISLFAGLEYRLGKKRVQGVFGGGLLLGAEKTLVSYRYGNQMTAINQKPSVAGQLGYVYNGDYRTLKRFSNTPNFVAGLVGTAGVEFFVAPKVALGAEVCLTAMYTINQQTYTISEGYNTSSEAIEQRTDLVAPMTGAFKLATENLGGNLYLSFYF